MNLKIKINDKNNYEEIISLKVAEVKKNEK